MVKRYDVAIGLQPADTVSVVLTSDYNAIAAELAGYKGSHEKYCPSAVRVAQLVAALTKIHGIVAEYWGPSMGRVEVLLTCREAIGESAKNWGPNVTSASRL